MLRFFFLNILLFIGPLTQAASQPPTRIAFYYGDEAPIGSLFAYDWVVLQPDLTGSARLALLQQGGTSTIAYVNVDEMARSHAEFRHLNDDWILGENTAWDSVVLDVRRREVRRFLMEKLVVPAMERGFHGVFLDTLDSHRLVDEGRDHGPAFAAAQAQLIREIKSAYPDTRLIVNRGFHLPASVRGSVDALAFESYRSGYDAARQRYVKVPEQDRQWLDSQLEQWRRDAPELPIVAIDYTDTLEEARELYRTLRQDGFIPYVSNGALTRLGPTDPAAHLRHVLVIHDLPEARMEQSSAHRRLGIILERLGLVPVYRSSLAELPDEPALDRYRAAIVWWEGAARAPALCRWLLHQNQAGLRVVTLGQVPATPACRNLMGDTEFAIPDGTIVAVNSADSVASFEGNRLPATITSPLPRHAPGTPWLSVTDARGRLYHPMYLFDGGGVAVAPFIFESGPDDEVWWLFDPFQFLTTALALPPFPAIDSTTENGRPILTVHIDGDGLVSRAELPGTPLASEVIHQRILQRYSIPHTVSVIEGETSPKGLYPDVSDEVEASARAIFREEHVEVASHTYSHPFFWQALEGGPAPRIENTLYGYFMNIPDYQLSLAREIQGSVDYINRRLAPGHKPVNVFLWSGDARPGEKALAMVRELGLYNVNGGDTHPLSFGSELAEVWPDARPVGDELQVYAPVINENVYTGLWTGPFYGYRNVIDSLEILENKGRLKPIGLYYHFYSGTKPEAIGALHEVYRYALGRQPIALYLSDYARKVQNQYYSALVHHADGGWQWRGLGSPSTVRIARDIWPDLSRSRGVTGFRDAAGHRFVHLTGDDPKLYLSYQPPSGPWLDNANGSILHWQRHRQDDNRWRIELSAKAHQPLELTFKGAHRCQVVNGPGELIESDRSTLVRLPTHATDQWAMECQ